MAEKDKKSSASYVPFRPLDSLFEPTVQEQPQAGSISQISIGELFPFKDHSFLPYTEERMEEMVESVKEYGVMSPIIARPRKEGGYEIISGHNRVEACERAGIETVPTIIRKMDDDTAIILMVDSNLKQRDKLKPSEKAKAYQMKMDALSSFRRSVLWNADTDSASISSQRRCVRADNQGKEHYDCKEDR